MTSIAVFTNLVAILTLSVFIHTSAAVPSMQEIRNTYDKICTDHKITPQKVCHEVVDKIKIRANKSCLPSRQKVCEAIRGAIQKTGHKNTNSKYLSPGKCEKAVEDVICASVEHVSKLAQGTCIYILEDHFSNYENRNKALEKACTGKPKSTGSAAHHLCHRVVDMMCDQLHSLTKETFQACQNALDKAICIDIPQDNKRQEESFWHRYFVYYPSQLGGSSSLGQ